MTKNGLEKRSLRVAALLVERLAKGPAFTRHASDQTLCQANSMSNSRLETFQKLSVRASIHDGCAFLVEFEGPTAAFVDLAKAIGRNEQGWANLTLRSKRREPSGLAA
jgi:hypothetical protein